MRNLPAHDQKVLIPDFLPPWMIPETPEESRFNFHIQWFSAEDEGRTEEPSETKIRKAREDGKVAKSVDLVSALVLLIPVAMIGMTAKSIFDTFVEMMGFFLSQAVTIDPVAQGRALQGPFFNYFIRLVLPILGIAFLSAVLANLAQVGFLFTLKPIKPDFSKIALKFGKYFQKSLFSGEAMFNLAKNLLKVTIIGIIGYMNIASDMPKFIHLMHRPFMLALSFLAEKALWLLLQTSAAMVAMSIPDYLFQRYKHQESLKMSKQEVKEERKQQDGDPLVKSRLRERMREIMTSNMMANVPKADVIITNPTHFAIGLQYDRDTMAAPVVLAKGMDEIALKIKSLAKENDVPVVENKPLARALYASVEIGQPVPEEYWEIVSRILAEVYRMNGRLGAAAV